ncbi:MAG: DUF4139 domain-containing protein [Kiritimatiellia bacterium]|nr:DUF4139 domain-containing protein [Kiritimatiellia bacterium]
MKKTILVIAAALIAAVGYTKVDLVTLPKRDTVQLTIYNAADLTLVRESRALTLLNGVNKLQFSWENTLIDPTSLEMLAKQYADKIEIFNLAYPPRVRNIGEWSIKSGVSGNVPVEILYLTSGLAWRAFYMGTLTADEKKMRLQGYVRVQNNSGEDYENAQTRLIVGKVHLIDQIAELAGQQYPYGSPIRVPPAPAASEMRKMRKTETAGTADASRMMKDLQQKKQIIKEGLSEYFLYTIEGTETIPHGWAKRLPSFEAKEVPVVNLYKYEEERYGKRVARFLSFKNDKEHKLGETPIPDGMLRVYRQVDEAKYLAYEGNSAFKYIPVDKEVELNLGSVGNVVVEPKLMNFKTDRYIFDNHGDVAGWDEIREFKFEVKNTRDVPIKIEVQRNFGTPYWDVINKGGCGKYEKVDLDTVKYTLELDPRTKKEFTQTLTTRHGRRTE